MTEWHFSWLTTWPDVFEGAESAEWMDFLGRSSSRHVFFTPALIRAWISTHQEISIVEPRFLLAQSEAGATVFLPLVITRRNWKNAGLRVMHSVGLVEYDYHDPLSTDNDLCWGDFWPDLQREVISRWGKSFDVFRLGGIRSACLPEKHVATPVDTAPYISLARFSSTDEFLVSLSQSLRGDIRRNLRRLEQLGDVKLRVYAPEEIDLAQKALVSLLNHHRSRWPDSYKAPHFHENLLREALPAGVLHFSELTVGGQPVSWHLGFCLDNRFYWYMPVYHPEYQIYSPGKVHLFLCIGDAICQGLQIFDLLRGDEGYKKQWTNISEDIYDFQFYGERFGRSLRITLVEQIKPRLNKMLAKGG